MASHGIKDRVAIVGMGCTNFVEHWDLGLDDLVIEASNQCYSSAGVAKNDVDAYWLGTAQGGMSGITLSRPLQLDNKPVTRVENFCATGSEALRQAAYAAPSATPAQSNTPKSPATFGDFLMVQVSPTVLQLRSSVAPKTHTSTPTSLCT